MCVSPSKSQRVPLMRDISPSKLRHRRDLRRRLFTKPRQAAYPADSTVFRRVLLVAAPLLLLVLLAAASALARQVAPSPPLPTPPSPPVPLLLVRQDTHVGSLWLTKLLETQNVRAFHQFDGVCKGGALNTSVAPRVPQALFAEGCGCRGSHPPAASSEPVEQRHKEQEYCSGKCVDPSPCKGVAAMADVLRARDVMASYRTRRYCGAQRAYCEVPKPRVVVLRRDNLVKRAVSSLKSDCYARDLANHATLADVTNVTNPTLLMVDPHLFLVRICPHSRLPRRPPMLTAAHPCCAARPARDSSRCSTRPVISSAFRASSQATPSPPLPRTRTCRATQLPRSAASSSTSACPTTTAPPLRPPVALQEKSPWARRHRQCRRGGKCGGCTSRRRSSCSACCSTTTASPTPRPASGRACCHSYAPAARSDGRRASRAHGLHGRYQPCRVRVERLSSTA